MEDKRSEAIRKFNLTDRQVQVLDLLGLGVAVVDMPSILKIEEGTVNRHKQRLMDRLGANNVQKLMATAFREGLLR